MRLGVKSPWNSCIVLFLYPKANKQRLNHRNELIFETYYENPFVNLNVNNEKCSKPKTVNNKILFNKSNSIDEVHDIVQFIADYGI